MPPCAATESSRAWLTPNSCLDARGQPDGPHLQAWAGGIKASTTIVFSNSEVDKSPTGYETRKQITVTRQLALPNVSKYLINGHKTTQQIVQTMFQSVQLNINNPNFVMMQGKITKVLNIRPQQMLGMVEEAAPARGGDHTHAQQTALREAKFHRASEDRAGAAAHRARLHAYEWVEGRKRVQQGKRNVEAAEKDLEKLDDKTGELQRELGAAEKEKTAVERRRDQEQKKGGKLAKLEDAVGELDKELAKIRTQAEIKQGSIKAEEDRVEACRAEKAGLESSLQAKIEQVEKINAKHKAVMEKHAASEELLQSLLTGLSNNEANNTTGGGGYLGQIAASKQQATQAADEEKQARTKLGMSESDLKSAEARFKAIEREAGDAKKKLDALRVAVESCRNKIAQCGWSEEKENQAEGRTRELRAKIRALEEERDRINQSLGCLEFNYNLGPNFDRKRVRGLEIATGSGKLQSVVVDDEQVGKMLLSSRLEKKVTIIPLNKIQPRTINAQKLRAVENIGGDKVRPAISLVKYDEGVRKAMGYVFSDTLICDDAKVAVIRVLSA
ncbi:SMC hinge domain-containing protein [Mycena chlorophos]|uniref:SMC hinge domain-containing protein n=1 Tax=Mycena chlorophos TaxID=658473 RepID=A0A8H6W9N8_MYCCL|nr:SMC hinge domain-containing protein [Mycena chlorophos]